MRPTALAFALGFAALGTSSSAPLEVFRVSPATPADPTAPVVVTFDRPVAGDLEVAVDPEGLVTISPATVGRTYWRDPVSLVFEPETPWRYGVEYGVTVHAGLEAMDGTRLGRDHVHRFRVRQARVLEGYPVGTRGNARHQPQRPVFEVVVEASVAPEELARLASVRLSAACGGGEVALVGKGSRRVSGNDPWQIRSARRDRSFDLGEGDPRRVIALEPQADLPRGCDATLLVPEWLEDGVPSQRWSFSTLGDLTLETVDCGRGEYCPAGPVHVVFSNPVSGAEVMRNVRILPQASFTVSDTLNEATEWYLNAELLPEKGWQVVVGLGLKDASGQSITGRRSAPFSTTGFAPSVSHEYGHLLVEGDGFRTLPVQHVNVDSLWVATIPVPDSLENLLLGSSWGWDGPWSRMVGLAQERAIAMKGESNVPSVTGVPVAGWSRTDRVGTLKMMRVSMAPPSSLAARRWMTTSIVQVTDLGIHTKTGVDDLAVWVTGVGDGVSRPGVTVRLHDRSGAVLHTATTDGDGMVHFRDRDGACRGDCSAGYVSAELGDDRAVASVSAHGDELSPWRFSLRSAWGSGRDPVSVAVFTERGIYRPGEPLYAKTIVREGALGDLAAPAADSVRWLFSDREGGVLHQEVAALSEFGTADVELELSADMPLGTYRVQTQLFRKNAWQGYGFATYRVAEYRPPEFLVDVLTDDEPRMSEESVDATVVGRYLFGAPMAGAPVVWQVRQDPVSPWNLRIPGLEGWSVGVATRWWDGEAGPDARMLRTTTDTLGPDGRGSLRVTAPPASSGMPYRLGITGTVSDLNRQTASGGASVLVHPASFYVGARTGGNRWFWEAGQPVNVQVVTTAPTGERVPGVQVTGNLVRREWHRVRRTRDGVSSTVGSWVQDTVATCQVRTAAEPTLCTVTPPAGGSYIMSLEARDARGRVARTTFYRWASGAGWVPWWDSDQLEMDVILDRQRYEVGDTATVMLAAPFTDVEAWVTVERERILESRRVRITDGATTFRLPIDERFAPNAFISVFLVRGRSAPPGPLDDPGRPTIRAGYAEMRVEPEVKRLKVDVSLDQEEYRPGDEAEITSRVRDSGGRGRRAEVTLWAVDEGVLSLTDFKTPDPVGLLYPSRGLGVRLASNMSSVAAQIPEGEKGDRDPGGGGGAEIAAILRSRFKTTAFFLGSVTTDAAGNAVTRVKLPDNLTTFRVMAVAVTSGDRYGSGESDLLVTRPLLARPALPRFVRPGDRFSAGVVVNSRLPGAADIRTDVETRGITVTEGNSRRGSIEPLGGRDVRFGFEATEGDSAHFTFSVRGGGEADAVRVGIPVRPRSHPIVHTTSGVLRDSASAVLALPDDTDPDGVDLEVSFGNSPLGYVAGVNQRLSVYPYYCSEQVSSAALPLIALFRAGDRVADAVPADAEEEIREAVGILTGRQRNDGGIGYWNQGDWTSPTLTAYAGRVLLEARAAGFEVQDSVFVRMGDYLRRYLRGEFEESAVSHRWSRSEQRLGERLAAVDLLSRMGQADQGTENALVANVAQMRWEDQVLLVQILARRGDVMPARVLLGRLLQGARVEGRYLTLPDDDREEAWWYYFRSRARPSARLLEALLSVDRAHPMLGPAVERLVAGSRGGHRRWWSNTYDQGLTVLALVELDEALARAEPIPVDVRVGDQVITLTASDAPRDTVIHLRDVSDFMTEGEVPVTLRSEGDERPVFWYLTLSAQPAGEHPQPVDQGFTVERWFEDPETGEPVTSAVEGDLVRVKIKVTAPTDREMVVVEDGLPAGLEVVDLSLRTVSPNGPGSSGLESMVPADQRTRFGRWDYGWWSPWDHKEFEDERVIYSATVLWKGTYTMAYLARATTAGSYLYPPTHAEEMYNPGVNGRSGGGTFTVSPKE